MEIGIVDLGWDPGLEVVEATLLDVQIETPWQLPQIAKNTSRGDTGSTLSFTRLVYCCTFDVFSA